MNENIIEIKNLTKIYKNNKNTGIFKLNFNVPRGSFFAFIGENGAGKTTTIKTITGSYLNYEGEVLINGINIKDAKSRQKLGYIPENAIFPKEITVYEYLKYLGLLTGQEKNKVIQKIDELLNEFGILELKHKKPYNFSSGQKKKILLIQALLIDPEVIILDEPAANLDPTGRYQLFTLLKKLHEQGKTIFISSHILSEIDKYVDTLTLIHKGRIVYSGPKVKNLEELFYEKVIKENSIY
ncbi:ABC transporter ATP-binding protein [Mycoplasmopsis cynos]|uniref:ABC-type multidrug-like transport system ATP-binding protein n=2 Tax=Mycoplasmopsis cynos TaxID=171284 RepID=L0RUM3_MYCC1|nr:ABC transporter ATP-binding protein [Mycoplasmopsis cynos]MCU9933334.1 ABC transporter ATP-binding protein [Mycoplasmopsis cynos]UWV85876.1 ABC transporter ATP-binding protein [Mycoplasmopsis cynos]WQQ14980.1 ABC transporter ATP-binding protein [Mycoplasmopsis cynos]WQQ15507.1 ABC transporter ATP-binding protein [Mycoplasmopsis cynos]WQQ15835.1 ABC transporter ATP-binding protein [Mycoplasmopsis cynos]